MSVVHVDHSSRILQGYSVCSSTQLECCNGYRQRGSLLFTQSCQTHQHRAASIILQLQSAQVSLCCAGLLLAPGIQLVLINSLQPRKLLGCRTLSRIASWLFHRTGRQAGWQLNGCFIVFVSVVVMSAGQSREAWQNVCVCVCVCV